MDLYKIVEILGERPFPPKSNYKMYLELKKIEKNERELEKEEEARKSNPELTEDNPRKNKLEESSA